VTASSLRARSFAKINLVLSVLGKRADGYHEIQTVFQTIDLCDQLEFRPSRDIVLRCENLPEVPEKDNLVYRTAHLLAKTVGEKRGVSITLRKNIPSGAGMGGGSSNAAVTLLGLRQFWDLQIPDDRILKLAEDLGSDVPFFLYGGTALGTGRGEKIQPLPDFPSRHVVLIYPGVHLSTAHAYNSLNLGLTSSLEDPRIQRFTGLGEADAGLRTGLFNDFEASILSAYPCIMEAKNFLEEQGAAVAMLSGSGSSVFGFFSDEESALAAARAGGREAWRVFPAKTLSRAEYFQSMFG
jgi:4-diphosphocytidyl-2-C-methyl-D-erythritol kinase